MRRRGSPSPTPSFVTGAASDDGLASASYHGDYDGAGSSALRSNSLSDDVLDRSSSEPRSSDIDGDSLTASDAMTDPLDDFLERYTCDLVPVETVAKLKKR